MKVLITRTETWNVNADGTEAHLIDYETVRAEEIVETAFGYENRLLMLDTERDEAAFIGATAFTPDTESSASRQNYIDNGFYLNEGEAIEPDAASAAESAGIEAARTTSSMQVADALGLDPLADTD